MDEPAQDHYRALGIAPDASSERIRSAWREACFRYHPDTGGADADSARLQAAKDAFETLCDPQKRAAYDRRRQPRVRPEPPVLSGENIRANYDYLSGELRRAWRFVRHVFRDRG